MLSVSCRKPSQFLQMRVDHHLKNLSMVLRGPRPLAFLEGGEEGESRLKVIKINTKKNMTSHFDVIVNSECST